MERDIDFQLFKDFILELTQENSRLYKMSILTKYKENNVIKKYLSFIFNPYIVTGISDKKLQKELPLLENNNINNVSELMDYLTTNNTGKDEDIRVVQYVRNQIEDKQLFDSIITKNLIIGVDVLTINKAIPNLIPTFNVMLAEKYFDYPKYIEGKEFALTLKIDGGRIIALKEDGVVKLYTRQGQPYEGLIDLEDEMLNHMPDNICLDGEITLLDKGNLTSKDQYKETMKITRKKGEKHGVKMLVFDYMTAEEFKNQTTTPNYKERRDNLNKLFSTYDYKYFNLLPVIYQGTDVSQITKYLNEVTSKGEEGVMINILDSSYEFKRTRELMKVKKMQDVDLEVVDVEEGDNRFVGSLGALICKYKNNLVKVGNGFTDELRAEIWANKDDWIGRTITVQYFEETYNSDTGLPSLRFPVYLDYRTDILL